MRYRPDRRAMLRAGRIDHDLYMLSDHAHIGFAYPWMRPPVEAYGVVPVQHLDGADAEISWHFESGTLKSKLIVGESEGSIYRSAESINRRRRQNRDDFIRPESGERPNREERPNRDGQGNATASGTTDVLRLEDLVGFNVTWERDVWRLRYMISRAIRQFDRLTESLDAVADDWPGASDVIELINVDDDDFLYQSIGLLYDGPVWYTQLELNKLDSDNGLQRSFLAGYWSLGIKHNDNHYYMMLSSISNTQESEDILNLLEEVEASEDLSQNQTLTNLVDEVEDLFDQNSLEQNSVAIGLRMDLKHNLSLKMQWDRTVVKKNGAKLWEKGGKMDDDRDINTYALALNYVF